jgi:glycosyltransferase involved in cell wall biosynthesis
MSEIKLSVVSAVYNTSKYLEDHIFHLLKNSSSLEVEFIFVNDGSTDSSLELLKSLTKIDDRVRIIDKENEGLSFARKTGWKNSKGVYVWFVDSDDYIAPNSIDLIILNINEKSKVDFFLYDMITITNGKRKIQRGLNIDKNTYLAYDYFIENLITFSLAIKVINRDIIRDSFFSKYSVAEDLLLTYSLLPSVKCVYYMPIPIYYYRINSNSLTKKYSHKWGERYDVALLIKSQWQKDGIYCDYIKIYNLIRIDLCVEIILSSLLLSNKKDIKQVFQIEKNIISIEKFNNKTWLLKQVLNRNYYYKYVVYLLSKIYVFNRFVNFLILTKKNCY